MRYSESLRSVATSFVVSANGARHDEQIPHRIPLIRIAGPREEAVVLIELRGVVLQGEPEALQVGIAGGAALALVHGQGEIDAGAVDLAPADAVGAADLEPE